MSYEATHRTFSYLFKSAERQLEIAKISQKRWQLEFGDSPPSDIPGNDHGPEGELVLTGGTFYDAMNCLTFCALSVEAAVNHVGAKAIGHWSHFEKKLSTREKIVLLADTSKCTFDFGGNPFNYFRRLQEFRNALAHGKTQTIDHPSANNIADVRPDWMKMCTLEEAEQGIRFSRSMIEYLFREILKEGHPLNWLASGSGPSQGTG